MSSGMMINNPTQSVLTMIPAMTSQHNQTWFSKFLKGEPKALGAVQIMVGVITLLFGIVLLFSWGNFIIYTGFTFWGSFIYISAGAVSAAAANLKTPCPIIASITMNVICAVTAGIAIILLSFNIVFNRLTDCYYYKQSLNNDCEDGVSMSHGISGMLLVLSLMQFIISIVISAFGCRVTCGDHPTHMYIISDQQAQNPTTQGALVQGTVLQYTQVMPQMTAPQSSTAPLGEPSFSAPTPLSNPQSSAAPPLIQQKSSAAPPQGKSSFSAPLLRAPPCSQKKLKF